MFRPLPVCFLTLILFLEVTFEYFCTLNSIEKVQLPDMGSYQCAVLSGDQPTLSDEGSIQLEGAFTNIAAATTESVLSLRSWLFLVSLPPRPSSFLRGTTAHVHSGRRAAEPELRGPRTSRAGQGHLAAGRRSSELPERSRGSFTVHTQPHRYKVLFSRFNQLLSCSTL